MRLISEDALAIATILQEAEGEPYAGKLGVAEVIRNRMNKHYQSDGTVSGTVLRPYQFSGWNTEDPGRLRTIRADSDAPVVQECVRAWREALAGSDTVQGAVLYFAPETLVKLKIKVPRWALPEFATRVAVVGDHHFFIPKSQHAEGV